MELRRDVFFWGVQPPPTALTLTLPTCGVHQQLTHAFLAGWLDTPESLRDPLHVQDVPLHRLAGVASVLP